MANKTILSTVYNNQELLWKITSGLNDKSIAISGAVSGMLGDYNKTVTAIATTLYDFTQRTNTVLDGFMPSTSVSSVLDKKIEDVTGVISFTSGVVNGKVDGLSTAVKDAFGEGAEVVVSKDGGITKSGVTVGSATLTGSETVLATEAAVSTAIAQKAIDLVGKDAIGVSGDLSKTAYLTIDGNDQVLTQSINGLKANIALSAIAVEASGTLAKKYALVGVDGVQLGTTTIDIEKDKFLSGAYYDKDSKNLVLKLYKADGTIETVEISLSGLVDDYAAGDGLRLDGHTFYGVVDGNSESYLTVGANGFSLSGVKDAIDAASANALDLAKAYTDGQISTLEGKAAASAVTAETNAKDYADGIVGTARTDLSAYVDALEVKAAASAVTAETNAKDYTDIVSGNLGTDIHTVSADLATEITNRETAITELEGKAAASAVAASGSALASAKAYTDEQVELISGTISGAYVTKDVFSTVASNIKADNEILATKYEDLETKLTTLLANI